MRRSIMIAALALAGAGLARPAEAQQQKYTFHDFGPSTAGGPIADTGEIGLVRATRDSAGHVTSVDTELWGPQLGTDVHLGNLAAPSAPGAFVGTDIGNDGGQLAGSYYPVGNKYPLDPTNGGLHGFLWTPNGSGATQGTLQDVGFTKELESFVVRVSDGGQVAGYSLNPYDIGPPYGPGPFVPVPPCPGYLFAWYFVNERAFRWTTSEGVVDLGTFGGPNSFVGGGVFTGGEDAVGEIVGFADLNVLGVTSGIRIGHPFLWTKEHGLRDLAPPPLDPCLDPSSPLDPCTACGHGVHFIGEADYVDNGEVAGWGYTTDLDGPQNTAYRHGFFWSEATGYVDIGTLGGTQSYVNDMRQGEIVGSSQPTGSIAEVVNLPAASSFATQPNGTVLITPPSGPAITLPAGEAVLLPFQTTIALPAETGVELNYFAVATLSAATTATLANGTTVNLAAGTLVGVGLGGRANATLPAGGNATVFSGISVVPSSTPIDVPLAAGALLSLAGGTTASLAAATSTFVLTSGTTVTLPAGATVALQGGLVNLLAATTTTVSLGTTLQAGTYVPLIPPVPLPDGTTVTIPYAAPVEAAGTYTLPFRNGLLTEPPTATLPGSVVTLPDGTIVSLPYGTAIEEAANHALHWQNVPAPTAQMVDLHEPAWTAQGLTFSTAESVRPGGGVYDSQIVGEYGTRDESTFLHAVLWTKGEAFDLHPCGWKWSRSYWIDGFGNIAIAGQDLAGIYRFAIYTPDPSGSPLGAPRITASPPAQTIFAAGCQSGGCAAEVPDLADELAFCNGGPVTITQDPPAGTVEPPGVYTLTFTVTDVTSGLSDSRTTTLTILGGLTVAFLPPLDGGASNTFTVGSTIPVKVALLDCCGNDVTREVGPSVIVTLDVDELDASDAAFAVEIPEQYNGVGEPGAEFRLLGDHFQYNLATSGLYYEGHTVSSSRYFRASVSVVYAAAPAVVAGSAAVKLESR
jgi:hypothetical protein